MPTYTVQPGEVVDSLAFTGRVSPVEEAELYFRTDGRVLQVYAQRGDAVQAGDKLAELDVSALRRQLAQAELALAAAQIDLESAESQRAYEQATLADLGALHHQALHAGSQYHLAHAALHFSARPTLAQHKLSKLLDATFWTMARDRWNSTLQAGSIPTGTMDVSLARRFCLTLPSAFLFPC
jgi:multidrug efflux pump subunit AcrA (membrane-fusion protein)